MTSLSVKGVQIGEGRPKTIVSIMGARTDVLLREALQAVNGGADCVEWRADYADDVHDPNSMARTAQELCEALPTTPLVFTFRSACQGGAQELSAQEYLELNQAIIKAKGADIVDIEMGMGNTAVGALISAAHEHGIYAIVSNHDFARTPSVSNMADQLTKMANLGADLPKLAVMAQSFSDCLRLMEATAQAKRTLGTPLVTMAMGEHGKLSRLAGEASGSSLTFCALEKSSAPGQVGIKEATEVLSLLHRVL